MSPMVPFIQRLADKAVFDVEGLAEVFKALGFEQGAAKLDAAAHLIIEAARSAREGKHS